MRAADYDQFVKQLQAAAGAYNKKLDDAQVALYWQALEDRPLEDVERRLSAHIKRAKFFPKPRELRPTEADNERIEVNPEAEARFKALQAENCKSWDEQLRVNAPLAKLLLADALLARYDAELDQGSILLAEKREWLKTRVAELLREADAGEVLNTYALKRLVLRLFSGAGVRRLEQRSREVA